MEYFNTDGASLPKPIRWLIVRLYPKWVIEVIDHSGYIHDWDMNDGMDVREARHRFSFNLFDGGIDNTKLKFTLLRNVLIFGLFVYDISPQFIKSLMKKTTNDRVLVVDIDDIVD